MAWCRDTVELGAAGLVLCPQASARPPGTSCTLAPSGFPVSVEQKVEQLPSRPGSDLMMQGS